MVPTTSEKTILPIIGMFVRKSFWALPGHIANIISFSRRKMDKSFFTKANAIWKLDERACAAALFVHQSNKNENKIKLQFLFEK